MGSRVHKVMLWGAQWWHLNWWVPWRGRDLEPDQGMRVCACARVCVCVCVWRVGLGWGMI